MPLKLKNSEGKEIEVATQEEIDALVSAGKTEVEDKYKKEVKERDEKLSTLESDLETAKEALDKASEGTKDWAETRKQIKGLEGQVKTLAKERDEAKEEFSKEIRSVRTSLFEGQVGSWMDSLSNGDVEVKKKIQFHYNRLKGEIKEEKEAQEVMKDAYLLATGKQAPNMFNVARGFTGEAPRTREPASGEVSDLGKKFGISDEDITKYGAKAQDKKPNQ